MLIHATYQIQSIRINSNAGVSIILAGRSAKNVVRDSSRKHGGSPVSQSSSAKVIFLVLITLCADAKILNFIP